MVSRIFAHQLAAIAFFCLLLGASCDAKKNESMDDGRYEWIVVPCIYNSIYDPKVVSGDQVDGAINLLRHKWPYSFVYMASDTPADPEAFLKNLEERYLKDKSTVQSLELPKTSAWEAFRSLKLEEIDQGYRMERFASKALIDPGVLDSFGVHDSCMDVHARAMIRGGKAVLEDWRNLTKIKASQNGSPERVWSEFDKHWKSSHRMEYARSEIMTYGWRNCANNHVPRLETIDVRGKSFEAFKKLFVETKSSCGQS